MRVKLYQIVFILIILSIALVLADNAEKEAKIFNPPKSLIDNNKDFIKNIFDKKEIYKRVIADEIDENEIILLENKGCLIKHRLKRSASFDCPENIISELNVRESRVFKIVDLEADKQIGADKVWLEGITGEGKDVVVLDTGVDSSHIELNDSIKSCISFVTGEDCKDYNGHGTHVVGIITANGYFKNIDGSNDATGVAPGAGIHMLKVCNQDGSCLEDDMFAAMEYAVTNINAEIMSISIGGGNFGSHCDSDPLAAKVNWVVDNGYSVAVAAGNDGKGVSSPACASKAIAVCAVDKSNILPWWSNRGSALDICAPGVSILSTYSCLAAGNCNSYWFAKMSGTSMSTPHIAGVIALLLQTNSILTDSEIKNALYTTANPAAKCYECSRWSLFGCSKQKEVSCNSDNTGAGIVNAYNAYLSVLPSSQCITDTDCNDGLFCNGVETCLSGICQSGTPINCSGLNNQCNTGICNEVTDSCNIQPSNEGLSCNDGLFCNIGETCQSGVCTGGSSNTCSDNNLCTTDSCNELTNSCEYLVIPGCSSSVQCWEGNNTYLRKTGSQASKFCKCAIGIYNYQSYNSISSTTNAYEYLDSGNNENWITNLLSNYRRPIYRVKCADNNWYYTNQDYFFG